MSMGIFEKKYIEAFNQLGFTLTPEDGVESYLIGIQEQILEIQIPKALRVFYLIGGKHEINQASNVLYPINEIYVWSHYLIFMQEIGGLENWGTDLEAPNEIDPPIFATNQY